MTGILQRTIRRLFAEQSPRPAALMRCLLGGLMFLDAAHRQPFVPEIYSQSGDVFRAFGDVTKTLPVYSPATAIAWHAIYLGVLLAVAAGWHTRISLALALLLTVWFNALDVVSTLTKYSVISMHLLFWLMFTRCDAWLSIDAWRRRHQRVVQLSPQWPLLMVRFLVCAIYLGAAITKIRLPDFATGDLVEFSLLDDAYGGGDVGMWLAGQREWLVVLSYAVILFEVAFPLLVHVPAWRRAAVLSAMGFHIGLWLTLSLQIFSPMMMIALLAFVEESDLRWLRLPVRRSPHNPNSAESPGNPVDAPASRKTGWRGGVLNLLTYSLVLGLCGRAGVWHAKTTDRYGLFAPQEIRDVSRRLSEADVDDLLNSYRPPYSAYFHRVEAGSRPGYRRVFGSAKEFTQNETVYVVTRLLLPHPLMELEWQLHPPDDGEPASIPGRAAPGDTYISIGFRMQPDFKPGMYRIQLLAREPGGAAELVWERTFRLRADAATATSRSSNAVGENKRSNREMP